MTIIQTYFCWLKSTNSVSLTETITREAESAEQDQTAHTCRLILLFTLRKINFMVPSGMEMVNKTKEETFFEINVGERKNSRKRNFLLTAQCIATLPNSHSILSVTFRLSSASTFKNSLHNSDF